MAPNHSLNGPKCKSYKKKTTESIYLHQAYSKSPQMLGWEMGGEGKRKRKRGKYYFWDEKEKEKKYLEKEIIFLAREKNNRGREKEKIGREEKKRKIIGLGKYLFLRSKRT